MFNYIKWELKNEIKTKILAIAIIAFIFIFVFLFPASDNILNTFCYIAFTFIMIITLIMTYLYGVKKTMDSYSNQTFLLESMIPLSPKKILAAKYLLAIIYDIIFYIIFILGLAIILDKADINFFNEIINFIFDTDFDAKKVFIRICILLLSSTIAFTALINLVFIAIKSLIPKMKITKLIALFIGSFIMFSICELYGDITSGQLSDYVFSLVMIILSTICFFATSWFTENKLEIYN